MRKAVEEVGGRRRALGDPVRDVEGEGRRRVDQSEEPGRCALADHSQGRGPDKGVRTHWVEEDYACNP